MNAGTRRGPLRVLIGVVLIAGAGAGVPATAGAAVGCSFASGVVQVDVSGGGNQQVSFIRGTGGASNSVLIKDGPVASGTNVSCSDPATSTVSVINVDDSTAGQVTTVNVSLANGAFEPGVGAESGTAEIEFDLDLGDGSDELRVTGRADPFDDNFRLGELANGDDAINLNAPEAAAPDADMSLSTAGSGADAIRISSEIDPFNSGASGDNTITSVTGPGEGFTGPLDTFVNFFGGSGDDVLTNGDGGGLLDGASGNDTLRGGSGNDNLRMGPGTDSADGNGGTDAASLFASGSSPAVLDLRITGPQDTGHGIKTISDAENAEGDRGSSDTIIGTNGNNQLTGGDVVSTSAPDTLVPLGGNDTILDGFSAGDTISYAEGATGPVTINLVSGQITGGAGTDTIPGPSGSDPTGLRIENVIGSPFDDEISASDEANVIDPGLGSDDVLALGGNDSIGAGDNIFDSVDCGADADTATADEALDLLDGCEVVTLVNPPAPPPPPPPPPPPSPSSPDPGDTRAPETKLDRVPKAKVKGRQAVYEFSSDELGSSFTCLVDSEPARPCASPLTLKPLGRGRHTLAVFATDTVGNPDASPASDAFRVVRKKKRR